MLSWSSDVVIGHPLERSTAPATKVDWFIFSLGAALLGAVVLPIVAFPEVSESAINLAFGLITQELGVIYVALATTLLGFLLYAAFGPWGHIRLGNSAVRSSQFSWRALLFCCGIGGSVIYWGASEWVFYYLAPPFSATPESSEATLWAATYGMFHWGPVGWASTACPPSRSVVLLLEPFAFAALKCACSPGSGRFRQLP